ncbi:MAG: hypothetical protein K2Z81_21665, partial [Cyanobacteria bacterium]|nr:hypothetical protein [Cyanobacteriota bacterium]
MNRGESAPVQVLVDGVDAYTAGIASGYLLRTINEYRPDEGIAPHDTDRSRRAGVSGNSHSTRKTAGGDDFYHGKKARANSNDKLINPRIDILFNPDQRSSWSFIPGIL